MQILCSPYFKKILLRIALLLILPTSFAEKKILNSGKPGLSGHSYIICVAYITYFDIEKTFSFYM